MSNHLIFDRPSRTVTTDAGTVRLTPLQARLFAIVYAHRPFLASTEVIRERIPDVTPDCIKATACHLRARLRTIGVTLEGVRGRDSGWRLPTYDADQDTTHCFEHACEALRAQGRKSW